MNLSVRYSNAKHKKDIIARVIASGFLLVLPSCQIPKLRPADPGPGLPVSYSAVNNTGPSQPAGFRGATNPEYSSPLAAVVGSVGVLNNTPGAPCTESSARLRVEEFFNDPILINLIHQALAGNQDLKILAQDVRIAGYAVQARRGALFPFVTVRADAGLDKSSLFTRNGAVDSQLEIRPGKRIPNPLPDFLVATEFTWQVDIWRKLRNARDAAALRYLATGEGRNYVVTRLVAQVAENYYSLLALDKRLETLDQTIAIQERSLAIVRALFEAGRGNEVAVQRFQAEVRRNQSEKLVVQQEIVETENRINFLAGRLPQPVERAAANFVDLNINTLSVGVPAQLLWNRPDVRQAERDLEASGLEVKVARAEFFPSLVISGGVGYEAYIPRFLFNPEALAANVAGGLVAPLVNRTAVQTVYGSANARQLQSVYNYQRVVLDALTEVVNRVSMAENYRKSIEIKKQQLAALEAAVEAAGRLFQGARVEYLEVLTAQRDLLEARTVLIETKRQQLSAVVNAYQALGGGGMSLPIFDVDPPQLSRYRFFRKLIGLGEYSDGAVAPPGTLTGPGAPVPTVVQPGERPLGTPPAVQPLPAPRNAKDAPAALPALPQKDALPPLPAPPQKNPPALPQKDAARLPEVRWLPGSREATGAS